MEFLGRAGKSTPRAYSQEGIRRLIMADGIRPGQKLPTYHELCKKLGVSLLTVHRAVQDLAAAGVVHCLHGKGTYLVKELHAAPHALKQATLVFPWSMGNFMNSPYLTQIFGGIMDWCGQLKVDLNIVSAFAVNGELRPADIAGRSDGLLMVGTVDEKFLDGFFRQRLPIVVVDQASEAFPLDYVAVDNADCVRQVMDHLFELGHRRIAYITESRKMISIGGSRKPTTDSDGAERRGAYEAYMQRAGLAAKVFEAQLNADEFAELALLKELKSKRRVADAPTAVLTYDTKTAGVLVARVAAAGISVPKGLSIAAAAGAEGDGLMFGGQLTFSQVSFRGMGITAVETLYNRCADSLPDKPNVIRVPSVLQKGTSTGRSRSGRK